jgi:hypothetical protein
MALFYISALAAQSPDALYAERADLSNARQAADAWAKIIAADSKNFDATWKLSRADYWLGGHAPESERRRFFEQGIEAGQAAAVLAPDRPEGHFWTAANMGALAESFGVRQGLKYRTPIRQELETVLRIAPAFQEGSADRALGRWYAKVPSLFGGSHTKAEAHLRASLTYDPNSTASRFFLAELLIDAGRKAEARVELQRVLDAPLNPGWAPEDREFKNMARTTLAALR